MNGTGVTIVLAMLAIFLVVALLTWNAYRNSSNCRNTQSVACPAFGCPCDGEDNPCNGGAFRIEDGQTYCILDPTTPIQN